MAQIFVRVTPRASNNEVTLDGEQVKVRVTAPATDNQANDAVIKLLAKSLGLAPSKLAIVRGGTARSKVVQVEDLNLEEVFERIRQTKR